jgi:pimeloyl-ACP methyl ester carboxylesterase
MTDGHHRTRRTLLATEETGRGEALVLLHGLATNRAIWSRTVPTLAQEHRVMTVDLPGFGGSAPVGEGFELEAVAERIARGLAARRISAPFDLVGHSLGAGVALTLASIRPGAVRRLILVAPAGLAPLPAAGGAALARLADPVLAARRALAPLTDLAWGRRLLLAFAAADGATIPPTQARMMLDASLGATRTAPALAAIAAADLRPLLAATRAPLGVIWGAEDRTVPMRLAAVLSAARPDADVVVLERAGHVPMVERPEAFTAALAGLLARLPKHATTLPNAPATVP